MKAAVMLLVFGLVMAVAKCDESACRRITSGGNEIIECSESYKEPILSSINHEPDIMEFVWIMVICYLIMLGIVLVIGIVFMLERICLSRDRDDFYARV